MARSAERRTHKHYRTAAPQVLHITRNEAGTRRTYAAKLMDFNEKGVGLEMFVPLALGTIVTLDGRFRSEDLVLTLSGRGEVVFCQARPNGFHRVGLRLDEVAYRKAA